MAETVLSMASAVLASLWKEANQSHENREELIGLATKVQDATSTQLELVHRRLDSLQGSKGNLQSALSSLHMTLTSVEGLIKKRGKRRSVLQFPIDALRGRSAKIQAEIKGAEANLSYALQNVVAALQIEALDVMEDIRHKFNNSSISVDIEDMSESKVHQYPWALSFDNLRYKQTRRGKPHPDIVLGSGSFGIVFRASYQEAGSDSDKNQLVVAVKEPHNPFDIHSNNNMRKAFFREANNLYRLHHRNVVAFVGAIVMDKYGELCYMLVTEILSQTLDDYVKTLGAGDKKRQLEIVLGMAEGLAYLHSMVIIHRDIKPQNIMLDSEGTPKYIDFGLSKEKETIQMSSGSTHMAGTLAWMSPEKKKGDRSTFASDVFSFGLVSIFVLTQMKPPVSQEERERVVQQFYGDDICGRLVLCCTREDPNQRPTSATIATSLLIKMDVFDVSTNIDSESERMVDELGDTAENISMVNASKGQSVSSLSELEMDLNKTIYDAEQVMDVATIIRVMTEHQGDPKVQRRGCLAMTRLASSNTGNSVSIAKVGGIDTVINAMAEHKSNTEVQAWGCRVLLTLALNADNSIRIANAEGITAVIRGMKSNNESVEVQEYGCGALAHLAFANNDNCSSIRTNGGIDAVVHAMKTNERCTEIQDYGCLALSNLSYDNEENVREIARTGGIDAIIYAMLRKRHVVKVQQHGCEVLSKLAMDADNCKSIVKAGGIEVVIKALVKYRSTADVLSSGFCVLAILAFYSSDYSSCIFETGGIDAIISGMSKHEGRLRVQRDGCWVLSNLMISNAENSTNIVDAGGVVTVIRAIKRHVSNAKMQENGFRALANLAFNNTANCDIIVESGGIDKIISGMRWHERVAEVQKEGCEALLNLAISNAETRDRIIALKGLRLIEVAVSKYNIAKAQDLIECLKQ